MQLFADVDNFSTWLLFQEANFMGLYAPEFLWLEMWLQLLQQQPVRCAQQVVCELLYFKCIGLLCLYCAKQDQVAHWQVHDSVITLATSSKLPLNLSTTLHSINGG